MTAYRDGRNNNYKVSAYLGNDPQKFGLWHVCKVNRNYNREMATPAKLNPWTTEEEAKQNLEIMAKLKGWEKI